MVTSTLLAPGETIDIYTIVEAMTPLGHIERYLATAKGDAPARVVLACAARSSPMPQIQARTG